MKDEMAQKIFKDGLDSLVMTYILGKIYEELGEEDTKKSIDSHVYAMLPQEMTKGEALFLGSMIPDKGQIDPLICQLMVDLKK